MSNEWAVTLAAMAAVAVLSLIPLGEPPFEASGADKLVHFSLYAGLGFSMAKSWHGVLGRPGGAALLGFALATLFGGAMEWLQAHVGRGPSWGDFAADASGAVVGVAVWRSRHAGQGIETETPV
ncbi:MAG: VanZ family protein [Gemmatimonadetes bacterium]|nr:VanZ family protein [Gemmatimonadota bacterium]